MERVPTRLLVPVTVLVLVVAGLAAWWLLLRQPAMPQGQIQANGRIEGDHSLVAGKMPGRVAELLAREVDTVKKDQVLMRLDAAQVSARVDQARQAMTALEIKAAQTGLAVLRKDAGRPSLVLPAYTLASLTLYAVYSSRHCMTPKLRTFIDFFSQALGRLRSAALPLPDS